MSFLSPARSALLLLGLLAGPLVATAGAATPKVDDPADGDYAPTVLALLHHQRDICDGIAGSVLQRWTGLDGSEETQERIVRDMVLERKLSELTAARSTADLVDRFLPDARSERGGETAASLERLAELTRTLCDTVALPTAPRDGFRDAVATSLDRIEREEQELGRLLVVPDAALAEALEPYLLAIELAGIDAEGEYLRYLESRRPKPQAPTMRELMQVWHRDTYAPSVAPTKAALAAYLKARREQDSRGIGTSCRELASAVATLLQNDQVFSAPDEKVRAPLHRAFIELRGLATQCNAARWREIDAHWAAAQQHLGAANQRLSRWGLRP
ncbi:MAG: hypothetical protein AAGC60_05755 [Acidobacteriota bacterium]